MRPVLRNCPSRGRSQSKADGGGRGLKQQTQLTDIVEGGALLAAFEGAALIVHIDHAGLAVVPAEARGVLAGHVEGRVLVAGLRCAAPRLDVDHAVHAACVHATLSSQRQDCERQRLLILFRDVLAPERCIRTRVRARAGDVLKRFQAGEAQKVEQAVL